MVAMRTSGTHASSGAELRPTGPIPTEGEVRVRVRYAECDPMNVAHHGSYVPWLELGRTELLRACGVSYAHLERAGVFLVITRMAIQYKAPARYDDLVVVMTRVAGGGRARIDHTYEVWRDEEDGRGRSVVVAIAETTLACVDSDGRPRALPEWLRASAHGPG